jgi:hypothetical protein
MSVMSRKVIKVALGLLVGGLLPAGLAQAEYQIKQPSCSTYAGGTSIGQSFTIPTAGNIVAIEVKANQDQTAATLEIFDGPDYSGGAVYSGTLDYTNQPGVFQVLPVFFHPVAAGQTYSWRVTVAGGTTGICEVATNPYAGGTEIDASGTAVPANDTAFRVTVQTPGSFFLDDFVTDQALLTASPSFNSVQGPLIFEEERDLHIESLSAQPASAQVTNEQLVVTSTGLAEARVTWDCQDGGADSIDPTGWGGLDLTVDSSNAVSLDSFQVNVAQAAAGTTLVMEVFTDGGSSSTRSLVLPAIASPTSFLLPYSTFAPRLGGGASFSTVGAVTLTVRGSNLDFKLDSIEVTAAGPTTIGAAKTGTLTTDTDSDAKADPGDALTYRVDVTNQGLAAADVNIADTLGNRTTLVPGSIEVSPIANDDSFTGSGPGLTVPAPGVLANDVDSETPPDPLTVFAPGVIPTSRGGSVTIAADGGFTYTEPSGGLVGSDTFQYQVDDGNGIRDTAVVTLSIIDTAPEIVLPTSPQNGADHVLPSTTISFTFSEPVNVSTSSFQLDCGGSQPFGLSATTGTSFTLTPSGLLPEGVTCTATVLGAQVTDVDANDPPDAMLADYVLTFTTEGGPTVASVLPSNGTTDVGGNTPIIIDFSEPTNVTGSSFTIACGAPVPVSVPFSFAASSATAYTLTPTVPMPGGSPCTVTVVAANVTDTDTFDPPDNMAADYTFAFTTDFAPSVSSTNPVSGGSIGGGSTITIDFSEPITASATAFTFECPAGTPAPFTTAPAAGTSTSSVVLTPTGSLTSGVTCEVKVFKDQISDVDANDPPDHMNADYTFTVVTDTPPTAFDDSQTVNEDSGPTAIDVLANDTDPDAGPKNIASAGATANGGTVVLTPPGGPFTGLTYQPAANYCGPDSFTYTLTPGSSSATVNVTVTCVNDEPAGTDNTVSTDENATYTFTAADFGFTDANDTPPNALLNLVITTLPSTGSLTLSGSSFSAGTSISAANITAGNLRFVPALNGNGTPYASFTFQVQDNGGTASGGVDADASPNTLTINVASVNSAPSGANATVSGPEDEDYVFTAVNFGFSDALDTPPNSFLAVKVATLPIVGTLTLSGVPVTAGDFVTVTNIGAGNLKFTPAPNASGSGYASFTFQVQDDGGTLNGGVDLDPTPNTITIDITGVNDAPAGTDNTLTLLEDVPHVFTAAELGFTDPNDTPAHALAGVIITTLPSAGTLTLSGSGFAAGTEISAANITGGNLRFVPATNASGTPYASFTFQVRDNGGTSGGGVDTDASPNTITVNVTAVNDAPVGANGSATFNEDTVLTFAPGDFGFTDPNDSPANNPLSVKITTLPATGSLTLSGAPFVAGTDISFVNINAGNLKFTPAANGSGTPYATFTFQVRDDGGTANSGVDLDPTPKTYTLNVTGINDAPAGTDGAVAAFEDTQYTLTAANFGFTDPNDSPANTLSGVVITTLPAAGTLTLSGSSFVAGTEIVLADITAGNLKFAAAANASGTPYATFTFQVRDNGGTANSGVDLDASPNTLTINVANVNDAPVGVASAVTTDEDVQYTFAAGDFGFTDPSDTPPNTLASVIITTLPGAGSLTLSGAGFAAGTEIPLANLTAGNLKFLSPLNANGIPFTTFTFQVRDNGGTANGGINLDPTPRIMTVNVTPVNDAPVITNNPITYVTAGNTQLEVAGATIPGVARATDAQSILTKAAPTDVDSAVITVVAASGTTGNGGAYNLIADGSFTYVPAAGFTGTDSITYQVTDGTDASGTATINITVSQRVWYVRDVVDANNAPGGDGRSTNAFETLPPVSAAANAANDIIFVFEGNTGTTPLAGNLTLLNGQRLLGQPFGLTLGAPVSQTLVAAGGNRPKITNATTADTVAVTASTGNDRLNVEIRQMNVVHDATTGTGNAIDVTSSGSGQLGVTVDNNAIAATGTATLRDAVDVNSGSSGTGTVAVTNNTISGATASGIDAAQTGTGLLTLTVGPNTITGTTGNGINVTETAAGSVRLAVSNNDVTAGGTGINVQRTLGSMTVTAFSSNNISGTTGGSGIIVNGNGTAVTFDADVVTGGIQTVAAGTTTIGSSIDPVGGGGLQLLSVTGAMSVASLNVFTSAGSGLQVTGLGVGGLTLTNLSPGSGVIEATGGAAVDLSNVTTDLRLATIKSTNSAGAGVNLLNVAAAAVPSVAFSAGAGSSITTPSGTDFAIDGGNLDVNYGGTISDPSGQVLLVANTTAGTKTFSGAITGGSVSLTSNTGATISITGGLVLNSGSSTAFNATGGGTVRVSGSGNTLTSTTGVALNVASTTIATSAGAPNTGLRFESISSNGASSGIVLNATGSGGFLTVTGTGSANSGGTIQNATGAGISLTSTTSPSFTNVRIQNTADSGVKGVSTTNFTFVNGSIDNSGTGLGAETSNIAFNTTAAGTENNLSGTVTITGNTLTNAYYHGIDIFNFNGTIADADISGNTITSSSSTATSKGHGIRFIAFGSASTIANVTKATIANNIVSNFPSGAGIMAQGGNGNAAGPAGTFGTPGSGTNVISITGNRVAGFSAANRIATQGILAVVNGKGQGNFDVSSNGTVANPITNIIGAGIAVSSFGQAVVTATVNGNVVVPKNTAGAQGIGAGTSQTWGASDTPSLTVTITNNQVSQTDGNGILVTARDATGTLRAKIQNNTVAAPLAGNRDGIRVDAGNAISLDDSVCLNISGNTTAGTGLSPEGIGLRKQGTASTTNDFGVNGMAATSTTGVETYVDGLNPASSVNPGTGLRTLLISATSGFSNCSLP